jgi:hypothetical protein
MITLARASSKFKRQNLPFVREREREPHRNKIVTVKE